MGFSLLWLGLAGITTRPVASFSRSHAGETPSSRATLFISFVIIPFSSLYHLCHNHYLLWLRNQYVNPARTMLGRDEPTGHGKEAWIPKTLSINRGEKPRVDGKPHSPGEEGNRVHPFSKPVRSPLLIEILYLENASSQKEIIRQNDSKQGTEHGPNEEKKMLVTHQSWEENRCQSFLKPPR